MDASDAGAAPAPAIAIDYWRLAPTATLRDVVSRIRDDECRHRDVNHELASQIAGDRKAQPRASR
jgi:ubiquinol oxidase